MVPARSPSATPFVPCLPRTEWQRRRFEQVSDAARLASERARPDLLAALNDRTFRERLSKHCAPLAANSSASDLLRRLRAEYSVAEVVSSFDAESPKGGIFRKPQWWSFTLSDGMAGDEMLNEWEVRVKHNESFDGGKGWFGKQDDVETKIYGLRPFASHGSPQSESEAAERSMCAAPASTTHTTRTSHAHHAAFPARMSICTHIRMHPRNSVASPNPNPDPSPSPNPYPNPNPNPNPRYALLNLAGADGGSPLYGDISAVLSPRHARAVTLLSAIDTGEWTTLCNSSWGAAEGMAAWKEGWHGVRREEGAGGKPNASLGAPFHAPYTPVCDAYNFTLGTLEHLDHLILANLHCAPRSPHAHVHTPPAAQPLVCRQGPLHPLRPAPCTMADWNRSLPESLAARLEPSCRPPRSAAASSLQPTDLLQYLEAMPAARLRLPDAVHFLIGSFPALFGSDLGAKLRSWCVQRGWILLWSLGLNLGPNAEVNYVSDDHSNPHFCARVQLD